MLYSFFAHFKTFFHQQSSTTARIFPGWEAKSQALLTGKETYGNFRCLILILNIQYKFKVNFMADHHVY